MKVASELALRDEVEVTVQHSLPARLRIHVSGWKSEERDAVEAIIERGRGIISAQANPLTGNVLVRYNPAFTDELTALRTIRTALTLSDFSRAAIIGPAPVDGGRRESALPDPLRMVTPVLHLIYSGSPIGTAMHLGEIVWLGSRRRHRRRMVVPILHLLCSCTPLGLVLHVGELTWAAASFLPRPLSTRDDARGAAPARAVRQIFPGSSVSATTGSAQRVLCRQRASLH